MQANLFVSIIFRTAEIEHASIHHGEQTSRGTPTPSEHLGLFCIPHFYSLDFTTPFAKSSPVALQRALHAPQMGH